MVIVHIATAVYTSDRFRCFRPAVTFRLPLRSAPLGSMSCASCGRDRIGDSRSRAVTPRSLTSGFHLVAIEAVDGPSTVACYKKEASLKTGLATPHLSSFCGSPEGCRGCGPRWRSNIVAHRSFVVHPACVSHHGVNDITCCPLDPLSSRGLKNMRPGDPVVSEIKLFLSDDRDTRTGVNRNYSHPRWRSTKSVCGFRS